MSLFGRRERREIAEQAAYIDRLREQRDRYEKDRDTAIYDRGQTLRQLAEADADNRRMQGRLLELGRRNSQLTEADPAHMAAADRRVDRLLKVAARLAAGCRTERARADRLQKRLDDAVGLPAGRVEDSARWQPGYQVPKAGGS